MFENLTKINPKIILNQISRRAFTDLSFLKLFADELTLFRTGVSNSWASGDHIAHISNCAEGREFDTPGLKNRYLKFILVDWKNEKIFKAERTPVYDPEKCWVSILQHPSLKDLAQYALTRGCQTRGPRVACDPQILSMRPARRFKNS